MTGPLKEVESIPMDEPLRRLDSVGDANVVKLVSTKTRGIC